MEIVLLADDPSAAKQVATWYFDEWISKIPGVTIDKVVNKLSKSTSRVNAPMLILAKSNEDLVGAVELKLREMDIYPEYEHWLGGLFVKQEVRRNGVGTLLVKEVIAKAKNAGIEKLYLQTEDLTGGLYSTQGFEALKKTNYKGYNVLIMVADLTTENNEGITSHCI